MKFDYLGEYDEFAIPHEFSVPLNLAERDNAIACGNGKILGTYSFVNESGLLAHAKRRAEFAVKLANGEIMVQDGVVLKRTGSQAKGGRILVTYAPIGETIEKEETPPENEEITPAKGIVAKVKAAVRGRGRPKKR